MRDIEESQETRRDWRERVKERGKLLSLWLIFLFISLITKFIYFFLNPVLIF